MEGKTYWEQRRMDKVILILALLLLTDENWIPLVVADPVRLIQLRQ